MLIQAFARFNREFPEASLVLIGQLRERDQMLRNLADELGCSERVVITGPRDDVPRLLTCFDIFAMSSHSEGLPVSLLEAMSLRKPVVCTEVGGIPGVVKQDCTGFLVPPGDATEMASCLLRLARDPALRVRLGGEGAEVVRRSYDVKVMVRQLESLYLEVMERRLG